LLLERQTLHHKTVKLVKMDNLDRLDKLDKQAI
jgi:hypothetical protein